MSGGGPSSLDLGGTQPPKDKCDISARVPINSPIPKVVKTLQVGDELDVELRKDGSKKIVAAVTRSGEVAGSLTPRQLADLIECLENGVRYTARVSKIDSGFCEVDLRRSG